MTYVEQIERIWSSTAQDSQDLASILRQLLDLMEEALDAGEAVPPELELELLLQANYALGFGSTVAEAHQLAILYNKILGLENHDLATHNISSDKFHRLACTLAGAVLSLLTSDEYQQISTVHTIPVWRDLPEDVETVVVIEALLVHLVKGLQMGTPNHWSLELLTFIITYHLLHQDLNGPGLEHSAISQIQQFVDVWDQQSPVWTNWKNSWLEYSDYYRFVTLLLTNTSSPEEIWLDEVELFLST